MAQKREFAEDSDPLDRAMMYREEGLVRKKLDDIGFIPENRGNLGLGTYHVHEVTRSCYSYPQCPKTKTKSEQLHTPY